MSIPGAASHEPTLPVAIFAMLSLLLFAGPAWAGPDIWTGGGPPGAAIRAVLVDPITPATIYVGTVGSGVFKSTDSGATWAPGRSHRPIATRTIRSIVAGPPGTTLYAGADNAVDATNGVFQSIDGGTTWTPLCASSPRTGRCRRWRGTAPFSMRARGKTELL